MRISEYHNLLTAGKIPGRQYPSTKTGKNKGIRRSWKEDRHAR